MTLVLVVWVWKSFGKPKGKSVVVNNHVHVYPPRKKRKKPK
jgi:hypothetical protein